MTTLGLISDTHMPERCLALPDSVATAFNGVDLILHAGDVGQLWVLDKLGHLAPTLAVHGNDETRAAERELPPRQIVAIGGTRILLWHSHYPDRTDELHWRLDDDLRPKLRRIGEHARRAGASIAIFGHWHIPLVYNYEHKDGDVLLVNPGAIAPGNAFCRQSVQSVAQLDLRPGDAPRVTHINLAAPDQPFTPAVDFEGGFGAAWAQFGESMLSPELERNSGLMHATFSPWVSEAAYPVLLRVAHRVWAGEAERITREALLAEVEDDACLSAGEKGRIREALG